jgi:hypothetical protein|tara:strand:+ start:461 stop:646 length:186 start_codon:yes stop_codon:yes gene_type:complete
MITKKELLEDNYKLRKQNLELLNEIEALREKIYFLEELAINSKVEYNDNMLQDREAWEEVD